MFSEQEQNTRQISGVEGCYNIRPEVNTVRPSFTVYMYYRLIDVIIYGKIWG